MSFSPTGPEAPQPPAEPRRMRISGLHHVTLIAADLERSAAFYRDVLGLALVREGANDDDPGARQFWFGDAEGSPGTLLSLMEYPEMAEGTVGRGSTHHFALAVDSTDELEAWRDYLRGHGIQATDVFQRGSFSSIYLRDPDGHIVEIATR